MENRNETISPPPTEENNANDPSFRHNLASVGDSAVIDSSSNPSSSVTDNEVSKTSLDDNNHNQSSGSDCASVGDVLDCTVPVTTGDKILFKDLDGETWYKNVTKIEQTQCSLSLDSEKYKLFQRIYYGESFNPNYLLSDSLDLLAIYDCNDVKKWERKKANF